MTQVLETIIEAFSLESLKDIEGSIGVCVSEKGQMSQAARRINRLSKGAIARLLADESFEKAKLGHVWCLEFLHGMRAKAVLVVKLSARPSEESARKAGGALVAKAKGQGVHLALGAGRGAQALLLGALLRHYAFDKYKNPEAEGAPSKSLKHLTLWVNAPEKLRGDVARLHALADGVFFARDLVNEPANILTTDEFASRLKGLEALGVEVEILEEDALREKEMRLLLSVGQGSKSPSKLVVMRWRGGADEAPFALVGKGVVFDTGGISLKPAAGMEQMTMDMGGAALVGGVMKALALRKARANVVGVIGLVENMPSGEATRPGDIVKSMKGDSVEIINTDAEGRLVLADCLWYTQERFAPVAIVNFATLTGAIIIALGHDKAGVFSNSAPLAKRLLSATKEEGEGTWQLPLDPCYDAQLKSRLADMKNVGTRAAGSITAAQFLQRFIKPAQDWAHIDIAGVALSEKASALAPAGASGWGVLSLNRLIESHYERKD